MKTHTLSIKFAQLSPGLMVVAITGLAALFLSEHYGAPVMLLALLLGIALSFLHEETKCKLGIEFVSSTILRFGVALVGFRIAVTDLIALGWQTGLLLVVAVTTTIFLGVIVSKALGMSKYFGVLTGGAVAICGASAALAISSMLPNDKNKERDTLLTIIGVTLLSTFAMIIYPIIAKFLNLDTIQTSIFLGGTIHDVAQVVGAGYSISTETGDLATLTKLVRVSFLIPVVFIFMYTTQAGAHSKKPTTKSVFPFFLIAFVALMLINSFIAIPMPILIGVSEASRFALVAAIAAIGMKSNLRQLLDVGLMPIAIMVMETLWIAGLFLIVLLMT